MYLDQFLDDTLVHLDLTQHEDDLAGELLRLGLGGAQALGDDAVTDVTDLGKALWLNIDKGQGFTTIVKRKPPGNLYSRFTMVV